MIGTRSGRDKFIDGLVISFLAAACAATIALNIGQNVAPGKILPTALSMRTGEMNENIDKAGGPGTGVFADKAIQIYCSK